MPSAEIAWQVSCISVLFFLSYFSSLFFSYSPVALLSSLPLAESLLLDPRSQLALAWASPTDLQLYNVHHCEIFQFSKLYILSWTIMVRAQREMHCWMRSSLGSVSSTFSLAAMDFPCFVVCFCFIFQNLLQKKNFSWGPLSFCHFPGRMVRSPPLFLLFEI